MPPHRRADRRVLRSSSAWLPCQADDFTGSVTDHGPDGGLLSAQSLAHRTRDGSPRSRVQLRRAQSRMRQWVVSEPMPSIPTVTVDRSRRNT